MLYSDEDSYSDQNVFESLSSQYEEDEKWFEYALDLREQEEYEKEKVYIYLFEFEEGPFRRLFPSYYTEESFEEYDLTTILPQRHLENGKESNQYWDDGNDEGFFEVNKKNSNSFLHESASQSPSSSLRSAVPQPGPTTCAVGNDMTTDIGVLFPTPASKFIDEHPGRSLIISIDKELNRKTLREMYNGDYAGIDFYVAYNDRESLGFALLYSTDETHIQAMQELYPTHYFATPADSLMFYKKRNRFGKKKKRQRSRKSKKLTSTQFLSHRMNDAEELSRLIEEMGGLAKTIFVAVDVEAAVVLCDAVPLPLELALVPLGRDHELPLFHCFLHPGKVKDVYTARLLSSGDVSGSHYIPFKNATFLRRDYTKIAEEIMPFLTCERVIFVNKGSLIDVHALMWVFAAAHTTGAPRDFPILTADDIFCFDIKTVLKVLSNVDSDNTVGCGDVELSCWYHSKMRDELQKDLICETCVHCALHDAEQLACKIRSLLQDTAV